MSALETYIDYRINAWNRITNQPLVDIKDLDDELAQRIFDSLDGDLSPENLHCDGEISPAQARKKAKLFYAAGEELLAKGFRPTSSWSEFA